ncbi:hypothetical protein ACJ41O_006155 [Fusarium nematophilum]
MKFTIPILTALAPAATLAQIKVEVREVMSLALAPTTPARRWSSPFWEVLKQQEPVPLWKGPHTCGGRNPTAYADCPCSPGMTGCEHHSWAHKVPSMMKANLYRDGVLLADSLEIHFGSTSVEEDGGCGNVGAIITTLVDFLPGPASILANGIDIFCGN